MQIGKDLQKKVKARIDKNQREYILREQLKLIREELGEENTADDAEEFRRQLKSLQASDEVKEKISKEIDRFKVMNNNASESTVLRGYIETLLSLPWDKRSQDSDDLKEASGKVTFFSRTKNRIWMKGETSGNTLQVVTIAADCDNDTLLIKAIPDRKSVV